MTDPEHKTALQCLSDAAEDAASQGRDRFGSDRPGPARSARPAYATSPFLAQLISERLRGIGLAEARRQAPAINRAYAPDAPVRESLCGSRLNLKI